MTDHDKLLRDMELALIAISEPYTYDKPTTSLSARTTPDMEAEMAELVDEMLTRSRETRGELQAARAEVEQLRADLREAVKLLREIIRPHHREDLDARRAAVAAYVAFLEKHKEMP